MMFIFRNKSKGLRGTNPSRRLYLRVGGVWGGFFILSHCFELTTLSYREHSIHAPQIG
jgi:hypothetical protein